MARQTMYDMSTKVKPVPASQEKYSYSDLNRMQRRFLHPFHGLESGMRAPAASTHFIAPDFRWMSQYYTLGLLCIQALRWHMHLMLVQSTVNYSPEH